MTGYHHISIASFTDNQGVKRVGIFAAAKPFSKGGKLEIVVTLHPKLNAGVLPSLTEARHILQGVNLTMSLGWQQTGVVFAPENFAPLRQHMQTLFAAKHHCGRISAEEYLRAASWDMGAASATWERHNAPTLSTDESAPRSDSAVVASLVAKRVRESLTESDVQTAINAVVAGYPGSEHGCALSPVYDGGEWSYLLWAVVNGERQEQRLAASVTPLPRLLAHWRGFIQNVAAMRAPKAKEQEAMTDIQAIPAVFSVAVVARQHVKAHSGVKHVEVARLTVNHTDDSDKAEELRTAARAAIHDWTPDSKDVSYIHDFMSLVVAMTHGRPHVLAWDVVVTFN